MFAQCIQEDIIMYPGYNSQKVLHDERVRNLLTDAHRCQQDEANRVSRLLRPFTRVVRLLQLIFASLNR
jgi:hypothetical protein